MVRLVLVEAQRLGARPDLGRDELLEILEVAARQSSLFGDRVAGARATEMAGDQVAHLLGDGPIPGDLAAHHGDNSGHTVTPGMVMQPMLARDPALVDVL